MNEHKLAGILGLAIRARQAVPGTEASRILIRSGKCGVLLLDAGTGFNTRKKADDLCRKGKTPIVILPSGLIESATGKSNMMIAIRKGGFAEQFLQMNEG